MDQNRQIRFLYPPFLLIGSLLLGTALDPCKQEILTQLSETLDINSSIALVLGGGLITVVTGYIIGTITLLFVSSSYETTEKREFYDKLGELMKTKIKTDERLYALVTFDHAMLHGSIHDWIQRRWHSYNAALNAITSLVLSFVVGIGLGITIVSWWTIVLLFLLIVFRLHASRARKQTFGMLEFQATIKQSDLMEGH